MSFRTAGVHDMLHQVSEGLIHIATYAAPLKGVRWRGACTDMHARCALHDHAFFKTAEHIPGMRRGETAAGKWNACVMCTCL